MTVALGLCMTVALALCMTVALALAPTIALVQACQAEQEEALRSIIEGRMLIEEAAGACAGVRVGSWLVAGLRIEIGVGAGSKPELWLGVTIDQG